MAQQVSVDVKRIIRASFSRDGVHMLVVVQTLSRFEIWDIDSWMDVIKPRMIQTIPIPPNSTYTKQNQLRAEASTVARILAGMNADAFETYVERIKTNDRTQISQTQSGHEDAKTP